MIVVVIVIVVVITMIVIVAVDSTGIVVHITATTVDIITVHDDSHYDYGFVPSVFTLR